MGTRATWKLRPNRARFTISQQKSEVHSSPAWPTYSEDLGFAGFASAWSHHKQGRSFITSKQCIICLQFHNETSFRTVSSSLSLGPRASAIQNYKKLSTWDVGKLKETHRYQWICVFYNYFTMLNTLCQNIVCIMTLGVLYLHNELQIWTEIIILRSFYIFFMIKHHKHS